MLNRDLDCLVEAIEDASVLETRLGLQYAEGRGQDLAVKLSERLLWRKVAAMLRKLLKAPRRPRR